MKKGAMTLMIVLSVLFMASLAAAGNSQLEHYYNDYVTDKIMNCCKTASLLNHCQNCRMKELKEMRAAQAKFYEQNRTELVKSMLKNEVGKISYKIDYLLITHFKNREQDKL